MLKHNISCDVVGVMSGTSLDGLDLALCKLTKKNHWTFKIKKSKTIVYSSYWKNKLSNLHKKKKAEIKKTDLEFGNYIGHKIIEFIGNNKADLIASHGHTIFHNPEKKMTLQIGNGKKISEITKITTVSDFRLLDISLNGQGAPLVPVGDLLLFQQYKYCLNLGGFANISIKNKNDIIAYDVCPANIILNMIAEKIHLKYDHNGNLAKSGRLIHQLFYDLKFLEFHNKKAPKSLSREWLENKFLPVFNLYLNNPIKDLLHTICEYIAFQISLNIENGSVLITGGGALNKHLIERIKHYCTANIIIPSKEIINFKEALIFGLLGILRFRNEINTLKSVTGANKNSSGGIIHKV